MNWSELKTILIIYLISFFSDEAHFHLHGGVNRHNFRYWSDSNPGWYSEHPVYSPRITVWAALGENGLIGPVFFYGNVTGASYLNVLENEFWSEVQEFPDHETGSIYAGWGTTALCTCSSYLAK